jgi:hypothetical protein
MSWKRLLSASFAVCVLSVPAFADPSIVALPRSYSAADGGIRWEIFVTQHDPAYTGALAVEIPLILTPHTTTPAFTTFTKPVAGGDDTNNGAANSWYYNQQGPGGADPLVWNITDPADPLDEEQNNGLNPFTGLVEDGLSVDTVNKRVFMALGSTVNLVDALTNEANYPGKQIRVAHIVTSDGILSWANAKVSEGPIGSAVEYTGISGSASSIVPGDMNANGNRNQGSAGSLTYVTTGASQNPTTFLDIAGFLACTGTAAQCTAYQTANPGLNGEKRADFNNSGTGTFLDIAPFLAALNSVITGDVAVGGGGGAVPEPTSIVLLVIGGLVACARRPRR